jgi:hypothetical protein|tara:strand:+ start:247 stop:531 length:285 start_codon:yes stop_codon:yes gene_type:complete
MKQSQLILLIKTYEPNTPVIITWRDAVDYSDEVTLSTLEVKEIFYETIGFFLKVIDDYVIIAYNKADDKTYRGTGMIPCSLITDIRRLSDGYGE